MTVGQTPIPGLFVISGHKVNVGGKKAVSAPGTKLSSFFLLYTNQSRLRVNLYYKQY